MKKLLVTLGILCAASATIAEDVTGEVLYVISKKVSEFSSNLIPGEGHT